MELFEAETAASMKAGFAALRDEMAWRREESDRIEREAERRASKAGKSGRSRPRPLRRVTEEQLQEAAAVWAKPAPAEEPV